MPYHHRVNVSDLDCFSFEKLMGRNMCVHTTETMKIESVAISLFGLGLKSNKVGKNFVNVRLVRDGRNAGSAFPKGYDNAEYNAAGYFISRMDTLNMSSTLEPGTIYDFKIEKVHLDKKYDKNGYVDVLIMIRLLDGVENGVMDWFRKRRLSQTVENIDTYILLTHFYPCDPLFDEFDSMKRKRKS